MIPISARGGIDLDPQTRHRSTARGAAWRSMENPRNQILSPMNLGVVSKDKAFLILAARPTLRGENAQRESEPAATTGTHKVSPQDRITGK